MRLDKKTLRKTDKNALKRISDMLYSKEDSDILQEAWEEARACMNWQEWYVHVYLCSDEWKNKRELVLERDRYICQGCLSRQATQVHHTTYKDVEIGNAHEMLFDLVSLCDECHKQVHGKQ